MHEHQIKHEQIGAECRPAPPPAVRANFIIAAASHETEVIDKNQFFRAVKLDFNTEIQNK